MPYESRIVDSLLTLALVPVLVGGLSLLFWERGRWFEIVTGLGLVGLSVAGWIDLADNCTFAICEERDPAGLTAGWFASLALLAGGATGSVSHGLRRRSAAQRHGADGPDCAASRADDHHF